MMTQEQQRIALAEWANWKVIEEGSLIQYSIGNCEFETELVNDLNAVHELEKWLNDYQKRKYAMMIHAITDAGVSFGCGLNYWLVLHTTASQRREALCRVLFPERWKDRV